MPHFKLSPVISLLGLAFASLPASAEDWPQFRGPNRDGKLQNHHGGMVLVGGNLYCGHKQNGGDPICIDIKTGKAKWQAEETPRQGLGVRHLRGRPCDFPLPEWSGGTSGGEPAAVRDQGFVHAGLPAEGVVGLPGGVRRSPLSARAGQADELSALSRTPVTAPHRTFYS